MDLSRCFYSLILFVALALTGCTTGKHVGGISVSLVDFRATEASLLENRGTLTIRYINENISPLGFSSSRHRLFLNGQFVGQATSDQPFGIPPMNNVTQEVTVALENVAFVRQLLAAANSQSAAYRLESVLFQTIYEDKFELKIRADGVVALKSAAAGESAN